MSKKIFIYLIVIITLVFLFCLIFNKKQVNFEKTLTVAFDSKILSADPRMIGSDPGSQYIEELRFLPLVSFDQQGNMIYVLANDMQFKDNKLFVSLKRGIHFANGKEITAHDVKSTYDAILFPHPNVPPNPRKNFFNNVESVDLKSQYEIVFTLKKIDVAFPNNLVVGILPKEAIDTEPVSTLIGKNYESGPFLLVAADNFRWDFVVNEQYDLDAKPKISKFCIRIIPDSTTRYAALIKGDIDIIQNSLDPDKIYLIENQMQSKFEVIKTTKLATTYLGFNFKDPIVSQKNVREALAYGLDRESILKYRLRSNEPPATGLFPENSFYFDSNLKQIPYKTDLAYEILQKSHLNLPIKLKLTVSSSNKTHVEIAKTIAVSLKKLGFDIEIENLENSLFFQRLNRGLVQMWLAPWVGFKDPDHLRFIFASSMVPPYGANRGYYMNQQLDELLEQGRFEVDQIKRKKIYVQAQDIIADDMPYLFLWHGTNAAVVSKRVDGFEVYADGRYWSLTKTQFVE